MANREPCYFFAPTWDYPPDGPIKLGNILTAVDKPEQPIHYSPAPASGDGLHSTEQRNVEFSWEKLRAGHFSLFTQFLGIIGVGGDLAVSKEGGVRDEFAFGNLHTSLFVPTDSYLQGCIEAAPVRRFLEKSRYKKPVYLVTGIKIVSGAKIRSLSAGQTGSSIAFGGGSGGLTLVSATPRVGATQKASQSTSWESDSDFVFAYRLRKIVVGKKTNEVEKTEDYKKGAMFDNKEAISAGPALYAVNADYLGRDIKGYEVIELMDGHEEPVLCALPVRS